MPLHRSSDNKVIAGVCGGIAEFLGWSPTLVRVLWVILTPTTLFAGFWFYVLFWLIMPKGDS
jgi:phage shock protein PspC (stress-responsive transcriptional regulator)